MHEQSAAITARYCPNFERAPPRPVGVMSSSVEGVRRKQTWSDGCFFHSEVQCSILISRCVWRFASQCCFVRRWHPKIPQLTAERYSSYRFAWNSSEDDIVAMEGLVMEGCKEQKDTTHRSVHHRVSSLRCWSMAHCATGLVCRPVLFVNATAI